MWEIKKAIEIAKREKGIKTIAFLRNGGIPEIFLAESFDRVYCDENSYFFLTGFSSAVNTFGEFFNKLKIKIESVKSGRLKSIPDILTKSKVPEEIKEDLERLISEIYACLSKETKKFSPQIYLDGILSAKELLEKGVIDAIVRATIADIIKKETGKVCGIENLISRPFLWCIFHLLDAEMKRDKFWM